VPHRFLRLAAAPALAIVLLGISAGAAFARHDTVTEVKAASAKSSIGYDLSYPQCGKRYPTNVAFGIVGVNRGIVFRANPCLGAGGSGGSQLAWAGLNAQLYMNTGNPGPDLSAHWPAGQEQPRLCSADDTDTGDCAYDYGWNAAQDAYATAVAAYVSLGWADAGATRTPVANAWWLDVETANSWRDDQSLNIAALQGSVDYLESVDVASVGIYSADHMWQSITGGTDAFAELPSWVAGASTLRGVQQKCNAPAFTGGELQLTQYLVKTYDADYPCPAS
jgi:hypothetical protein